MRPLRSICLVVHIKERSDTIDINHGELRAITIYPHLLRSASKADPAFLLDVWQSELLNCAAHSSHDETISARSDACYLVGCFR
jgi:hypothetical protein